MTIRLEFPEPKDEKPMFLVVVITPGVCKPETPAGQVAGSHKGLHYLPELPGRPAQLRR